MQVDKSVQIFFDCGAPSLYNKLSKSVKNSVMGSHMAARRHDSFAYVETPEYQEYREAYAQHLLDNQDVLLAYPNLDVINNPELTWENQQWMEARGLHPNPVWHFGSDEKWLHRYLDAGYEYICIGGMVPNSPRVLRPALDRLWCDVLCRKDGMPRVKVHGFAMTSFELMYRYPWFSVDSKSWIDYARFGRILVPLPRHGKIDWFHPIKVAVSNRSFDKNTVSQEIHFKARPVHMQKYIMRYLERIGIAWGRSTFHKVAPDYKPVKKKELWFKKGETIERIEEGGVSNTNVSRMDVNAYLYCQIEAHIPAWPWPIQRTIPRRKKGLL